MNMKIPVRSLVKSNWMMVLVSSGFLCVFLTTYSGFTGEIIFTIVHAGLNMLAVSFMHIGVLILLNRYASQMTLNRQRIYRYSIAYVLTIILSFCIRPLRALFADETWRTSTLQQQIITVFTGGLALNMLVLIMHNLVIAYQAKTDAEIENAELKAANAEANNLLLKQQIQPHFLFNALNILKTLYKKDVNSGDEYIVHLANFLRASVSNTSEKVVKLADEIKICTDYIAMQKIRFGDALQCDISIDTAEGRQDFVPSFSLQPLLENAIKHNDATNQQPLYIRLFKEDGYIVVENNLQPKKQPVPSGGYGLSNLMKRYELLSGEEIIIKEDETAFSVRLKILTA